MKIVSRYDSTITLYESDTATTFKELVNSAVKDRANLSGADLSGADLSGADLSGANLSGADLSGANLIRANLYGANLIRANLYGANLIRANLYDADLSGADLSGANLIRANLIRANLSEVKNMPPISILPEGVLIGWKKLKNDVIAKLQIPAKAQRVNSTGRKCRAEYVKVLALYNTTEKTAHGTHDPSFLYEVGKIVTPDSYNPDFRVECSNGIHFFITRKEAENY